jgi:hypothetical protein
MGAYERPCMPTSGVYGDCSGSASYPAEYTPGREADDDGALAWYLAMSTRTWLSKTA